MFAERSSKDGICRYLALLAEKTRTVKRNSKHVSIKPPTTVIFRKTALCGMITDSYKIHISPHRLTTGPEQNHKIIVKEVPLSESTRSFTPRDFPHRKEAIFMYYSDIDEDDLDGLPSILTPAMAAD